LVAQMPLPITPLMKMSITVKRLQLNNSKG
jgi:hypothetical protein